MKPCNIGFNEVLEAPSNIGYLGFFEGDKVHHVNDLEYRFDGTVTDVNYYKKEITVHWEAGVWSRTETYGPNVEFHPLSGVIRL